ncbi:MAG: lamin tail domain-containing protein [Chitinophagaceae bacterium]|nr:lamin tail domain-containing protein [Chitinophagaceae bacterium]
MFFSHFQVSELAEIQGMKMLLYILSLLYPVYADGQPRYSVIINEIMAAPAPQIGLPNYEWIEVLNTGEQPVDLRAWRLGDNTTISGLFPDFILAPKQYLILCASSARAAMQAFGDVLVVPSFPSLDNAGEQLYLISPDGRVIHSIRYADTWHDNSLKKEGGWTLEMIDSRNPCTGQTNWRSSISSTGGTPGKMNSIAGQNTDQIPPVPLRTYSASSKDLVVVFSEPLDSNTAVTLSNYQLSPGGTIIKAMCRPPLFEEVELETAHQLDSLLVYELLIQGVQDCAQNQLADLHSIKTGIASAPAAAKPVINEILFNPRPNGDDYVELLNQGPQILDASRLYLANRNTAGAIGIPVRLTATPYALFPGEYLVATANAQTLRSQYFVKNPLNVLELSLPSFPDDKGTVILMDQQGLILDEVRYSKDWHFKLIADPDGVALERIDPNGVSSSSGNWHSAASTVGYGTPTYRNSQFMSTPEMNAEIDIDPKIFSPDNDGFNDLTRISYRTTTTGLMGNVFIFDLNGRLVQHLVKNELLSITGYWNWNGTDERQRLLPAGRYIIEVEIFTLQGQKRRIRKVAVLAKKAN